MARPVIKFAMANPKQLRQLREIYQTHRLPSHRRRAYALILSSEGYSPAELADILDAHPDTIRRWIDHFNSQGCAGLVDQPRSGSERMLDVAEQETLRELIDAFPNQPRWYWTIRGSTPVPNSMRNWGVGISGVSPFFAYRLTVQNSMQSKVSGRS